MLTAAQQRVINRFAKGLLALSDDALIDTYHQVTEDLRAARAEGSDNLGKAHAQALAPAAGAPPRMPVRRTRFAPDSLQEGDGFEPSIPRPRRTGGSDFAAGRRR
jgi:hypothetical protein